MFHIAFSGVHALSLSFRLVIDYREVVPFVIYVVRLEGGEGSDEEVVQGGVLFAQKNRTQIIRKVRDQNAIAHCV